MGGHEFCIDLVTYLCTMPPWSSSPAESDGAAEHPTAADSCRECIGWTTYTTAMRAASEPPRCIGLVRKRQGSTMPRMPSAKAAEEMDIVEQQSFKYTCVGTSLSGGADMQNAGRLPACRGIKIVAVRDPAEADAVSGTGASTPARGVRELRAELRRIAGAHHSIRLSTPPSDVASRKRFSSAGSAFAASSVDSSSAKQPP